jgi:hypothetical protein
MDLTMLKSQRWVSDRTGEPPDALLCQPFDAFRSAQGESYYREYPLGENERTEMSPSGRALEFLTTR